MQIAGVMARRIICRAKQGDQLARGERFGLIMFGSRTDTYLPEGCRVEVTEGQRVKGGEDRISEVCMSGVNPPEAGTVSGRKECSIAAPAGTTAGTAS